MRKKILVIEDDRSFARLAEYTLGQAGYEVLMAYDGFEGLSKSIQESPDLIIMDTMLPGMDGGMVCNWLRMNAATALMPILAVSLKVRPEDCGIVYDHGADYYLEKPLDLSLMLEKVADLVESRVEIDNSWLFNGQNIECAC